MAMHLVIKYLEAHPGVGFTIEQLATVFGDQEDTMRSKISRMRGHAFYRDRFTTVYETHEGFVSAIILAKK
jgi:hypothetical protein